jgi:hypothetical protein
MQCKYATTIFIFVEPAALRGPSRQADDYLEVFEEANKDAGLELVKRARRAAPGCLGHGWINRGVLGWISPKQIIPLFKVVDRDKPVT